MKTRHLLCFSKASFFFSYFQESRQQVQLPTLCLQPNAEWQTVKAEESWRVNLELEWHFKTLLLKCSREEKKKKKKQEEEEGRRGGGEKRGSIRHEAQHWELSPTPPSPPPPPPSLEKQSSFPWDGVHRLNMMICLRERLLNATARRRRLSHTLFTAIEFSIVCACARARARVEKAFSAFYAPDGLWKGFVCPCIHGNMSTFFFFCVGAACCVHFSTWECFGICTDAHVFRALQQKLKTHAAFSAELSVFHILWAACTCFHHILKSNYEFDKNANKNTSLAR